MGLTEDTHAPVVENLELHLEFRTAGVLNHRISCIRKRGNVSGWEVKNDGVLDATLGPGALGAVG